ncbi:predicted protein [Plenodomus lingam JN3]|uniref:Predicted protein n=1 Tax=Leptosphaeria maculans (strain JN3 / isolate v23.1.3 / race Av1-4-5-6-7-8) TaxID=985895 RepID=E5A852_LEPMJ|nr:predicted protein [Plenodomus lingam JN3]CBX99797.1 predicted protein [Plenodomus lingam JN3]
MLIRGHYSSTMMQNENHLDNRTYCQIAAHSPVIITCLHSPMPTHPLPRAKNSSEEVDPEGAGALLHSPFHDIAVSLSGIQVVYHVSRANMQ